MRVALAGQTGPYAPVVLRYLLAHAAELTPTLVIEGLRLGKDRAKHQLRKPQPGPLPNGEHLGDLAVAAGIPVLITNDVNGRKAVAIIDEYELDCLVCAGFDRLFSPSLLSVFRRGAINAHPSLLPRWRGPSPLFWAIRQGDRTLGVTIHAMDTQEDHGPIYAQTSFVPSRRCSGEDLYRQAASIAASMLLDTLQRLQHGNLRAAQQDHTQHCRAPRPTAEDARIDPSAWDCQHLVDFCTVAPFFRTPWMVLGDETFFVRRGELAEPGRQLAMQYILHGSLLVVQCRDGLAHLEIQI